MIGASLLALAFGSKQDREFHQTVKAWRRGEEAWRRSRFAREGLVPVAERIAAEVAGEALQGAPVRDALSRAIEKLLLLEDLGELQVEWETIRADPIAAHAFRQMLVRRRRWTHDADANLAALSRVLRATVRPIMDALQESEVASQQRGDILFEVPITDVVGGLPALVERLIFSPYDQACLDRDLFVRLRQAFERNLVLASSLPPSADIRDHVAKLVIPTKQKGKSASELADLYLAGTPWRAFFDTPLPFRVSDETRFEHTAIIAGTGQGKTQLIQRLVHADLIAAQHERRSVVVIDSQGDMINRLVRLSLFAPGAPGGLADRLILVDPSDIAFPPSLNLFDAHLDRLEGYGLADRERVLNGIVELYETFFADLLGSELTAKQGVVWKYLARLMLTIPGATIYTLMDLMTDAGPYRSHMARLEGAARFFFETEFHQPAFAQTKRQILRRLWGVLSTPAFERMLAQPTNKLDLFRALQDGSIILINTAKDLLKTEGSQLFGRFFIKLIAQAALERATVDMSARTPTMLYADEAQEYFDDSTETLLNQARKRRVGVTTAFQTLDLVPPRLRAVLLADTSIKCVGGVSARDARALAEELQTTPEFIQSMQRRRGRAEFAIWVKNQTPHALRLPVPLGFLEAQPILAEDEYEELIRRNRARYCGTLADAHFHAHPSPDPGSAEAGAPPDAGFPGERFADEPPIEQVRPASPLPTPGKGGVQHKYLQQLIKQLAEERGLRAVIEEAVPGGQVDVGLHQGELSIACEISVTSTPGYEAQNLAKCLAAGFARVWAIAPDAKRRKAIQAQAEARLGSEDAARVEFLTTEELIEALDGLTVPEPEEKVVKGYRVKTTRKTISAAEAKERRANIARILSQSGRTRE